VYDESNRGESSLKNKKVSVVILNWNRKEMVLDCLEHIKKLEYPVCEIIVVDNASTDGSVEALRKEYPDAKLIVNDKNYGAPEGKNIGLREAVKSNTDYIYMVDNDIVVKSSSLSELIKVGESDPQVGMVGTMMYDYSKQDIILSAGGTIDFTQNVSRGRGDKEKDTGQFDKIEEVDYLWGGAMLVKREVLIKVGFFDPKFVGYWFEDTDLSVRVRKAGFRVVFCPWAKVWHKPHATVEQFSYRKKYLATKNAIRFMKKHARLQNWIKYLFFAIGGLPYAFIRDLILHKNVEGVFGKAKGIYDGLMCPKN
jgi:GT2 family glycosyltransferase